MTLKGTTLLPTPAVDGAAGVAPNIPPGGVG